jgi:hypothetical protein
LSKHSHRRRRAAVLALAAAFVVVMVAPASSEAVTYNTGTVTVSLGGSFAKAMKRARVRLRGLDGAAVSRNRRAILTMDAGTGGPLSPPFMATLDLRGTLRFQRRSRRVNLGSLDEVVAGTRGRLVSRRRSFFSQSLRGRVFAAQAAFVGLNVNRAAMRLTRAGARALNRALRTRVFKTNMSAGNVTVRANRSVSFTDGSTSVVLDSNFVQKLVNCGISPAPIGGATIEPGSKLRLPGLAGTLGAVDGEGQISHAQGAGLRLSKGGPSPHTSDLTDIRLDTASDIVQVFASDVNRVVPIGPLSRAGRNINRQLTASGGTFGIHGGDVSLGAEAANLINGNFGCSTSPTPFQTGDRIGNLEGSSGPVV